MTSKTNWSQAFVDSNYNKSKIYEVTQKKTLTCAQRGFSIFKMTYKAHNKLNGVDDNKSDEPTVTI